MIRYGETYYCNDGSAITLNEEGRLTRYGEDIFYPDNDISLDFFEIKLHEETIIACVQSDFDAAYEETCENECPSRSKFGKAACDYCPCKELAMRFSEYIGRRCNGDFDNEYMDKLFKSHGYVEVE